VGTTATGRSRTYSYYTCSTRYRYGTKHCSADRLPRELLEDQVFDQLAEVYQDSELIADALNQARLATEQERGETERRLEALGQERAGSQRALDRYFAAFEEGSLTPAQCKERIGALQQRLDSLAAEEISLSRRGHDDDAGLTTAGDLAKWAQDLPGLLLAGSAQQRKALLRKLIKELRVISRDEIVPTYKIPALVRAPMGQVEGTGHNSNLATLLLSGVLTT
jgi:site-specific DNA recombinase